MSTFLGYKAELFLFCFLAVWAVLSSFNRLSLDDWCLSMFVKDTGFKEFIVDFWLHYEGAISSLTANFIIFKLINHSPYFAIILNVGLLSSFLLSLNFMTFQLSRHLSVYISRSLTIQLSLLFFTVFYVLQPQHKGVFFNYNWSTCYFLPITVFALALAFLFEPGKMMTRLSVSFFFILGAWRLHYSLMFIFILACLYLLSKKIKWSEEFNRRIIYSVMALILSVSIYLMAPGNFARSERLNSVGQHVGIIENLLNSKLVNWFLFYENIVYHAPNAALVILVLIFFGAIKYDINSSVNNYIICNYKRVIIFATGWIILITLFNGLFFQALAGKISYNARVYLLMYFLIAAYVFFVAYVISMRVRINILTGNKYIHFIIILILFGYFLVKIPRASSYADAFDKRDLGIRREVFNGRTADLYINALPESGIYETGEFTSKGDSSMSFINDCAKDYYAAKFNIYQIEKINYE